MTYLLAIPLAILLAVTPTVTGVAHAQLACGPRSNVLTTLEEKYDEARVGMGLAGPTMIIEIWTSEETGTWTITRTTPNGITCIMAVGNNWINITPSYATPTGA